MSSRSPASPARTMRPGFARWACGAIAKSRRIWMAGSRWRPTSWRFAASRRFRLSSRIRAARHQLRQPPAQRVRRRGEKLIVRVVGGVALGPVSAGLVVRIVIDPNLVALRLGQYLGFRFAFVHLVVDGEVERVSVHYAG